MKKPRTLPTLALLAACVLNARAARAQGFQLEFRDGLVTLVAREISIPKILELWSRIGHATVVNGEKLDGLPITLELVDVPERDALAILLRSAGGYILMPRHEGLQGASAFDRVFVVQSSRLPISNPPLPQSVQASFASSPDAEPDQTAAGSSPEAAGTPSPFANQPARRALQPGVAPFAPQAGGAPAGMPGAVPSGTARPGEVLPQQPVTRTSSGPQRPPQ
jgi:hypothetical protein